MFSEMRADANVKMESPPQKRLDNTPTILVFKVAGGEQVIFSEEAIIKIGNLSSSHLRLDHPSVSSVHAVIEFDGYGQIELIDLGSTAGTEVNGKAVAQSASLGNIIKKKLKNGDLLKFGNLSVELTVLEKDPRPTDSGRACVDCSAPMLRCYLEGVEIDVCKAHGAWFDDKELQTVLHRLTL